MLIVILRNAYNINIIIRKVESSIGMKMLEMKKREHGLQTLSHIPQSSTKQNEMNKIHYIREEISRTLPVCVWFFASRIFLARLWNRVHSKRKKKPQQQQKQQRHQQKKQLSHNATFLAIIHIYITYKWKNHKNYFSLFRVLAGYF